MPLLGINLYNKHGTDMPFSITEWKSGYKCLQTNLVLASATCFCLCFLDWPYLDTLCTFEQSQFTVVFSSKNRLRLYSYRLLSARACC